jgi:hypothetical protein
MKNMIGNILNENDQQGSQMTTIDCCNNNTKMKYSNISRVSIRVRGY